jgi:glycosyltransferase involved in cell wall biosynthesis
MPTLVAVVLTLNEERHITECLASLAWADARLVFDSFSTDRTVALARAAGAEVAQNRFANYAQQRNDALKHVQSQQPGDETWVFFVDADERCTPALADELRAVVTGPDAVARPVWSVPRHNYLFGRLTKGAGWYPDFQARLFHVGRVWFDPLREVHEVALFEGAKGLLRNELTHFNYDDVGQFHRKQRTYAEYDASILFKQGIRPKLRNFVLQPLREFHRRFIRLRGYSDGMHGLRLALLMAYYNFDMYRRLARMWRGAAAPRTPGV